MKPAHENTPDLEGKNESLGITKAFDGMKEGDEFDEQMEIDFDGEVASEPFIPIVDDDIPEPQVPLIPERKPEEKKDSEIIPESQEENSIKNEDKQSPDTGSSRENEAETTEENDQIPFGEGKRDTNQKAEGEPANSTDALMNTSKNKQSRQDPLPSHQQVAAGLTGGVWGLGQLVKSALGLDSNRINERISKRAEANYQKNIDKLLGAYANAGNAIDNLADSGAAHVRDQYRKDGAEPSKSVLKQLAEDEKFRLNNKNLKSSLEKIELYSKKIGPSAKAAGLDMRVAEDFLNGRNEELSKRAEKIDQLVDKDGKSIFDSIKNVVEKVKQVITAFLARTGLAAGRQQEQIS